MSHWKYEVNGFWRIWNLQLLRISGVGDRFGAVCGSGAPAGTTLKSLHPRVRGISPRRCSPSLGGGESLGRPQRPPVTEDSYLILVFY